MVQARISVISCGDFSFGAADGDTDGGGIGEYPLTAGARSYSSRELRIRWRHVSSL